MNIKGQPTNTVYPLMGTIRLPQDAVGKGKLSYGIKKTDSAAFNNYLKSLPERIAITWQKDNRVPAPGGVDCNPFLASNDFTQDGVKKTGHSTFFSTRTGKVKGEDGKPMMDENGAPIRKEGDSQVHSIFKAIPSVEITKGAQGGTYMHFACDAPVKITGKGTLIPDVAQMVGKPAEKGMGDAQFAVTLDAKRARRAELDAGKESPAAQAEAQAEAQGQEAEVPEGPEMG